MNSLPKSLSNIFLLPDPMIKEYLPYTEEYIYYPIYQYTEILQEYFENKLIGEEQNMTKWQNFKQIHLLNKDMDLLTKVPSFIFTQQKPLFLNIFLNKIFDGSQGISIKFKDEKQVFVNNIDFIPSKKMKEKL